MDNMLTMLLGIIIGVVVACGALAVLAGPAHTTSDALVAVVAENFERLLGAAPPDVVSPSMSDVVMATAAAAAPAVVAACLVAAARIGAKAAPFLAVALTVLQVAAFVTLPPSQAIYLLPLFGVAVSAALGAVKLAQVFAWALATWISITAVSAIWSGTDTAVSTTADVYMAAVSYGGPAMWQMVATAVVLLPFVALVAGMARTE